MFVENISMSAKLWSFFIHNPFAESILKYDLTQSKKDKIKFPNK